MSPEGYKEIIWEILIVLKTVMVEAGGMEENATNKLIRTIYKSITGDSSKD